MAQVPLPLVHLNSLYGLPIRSEQSTKLEVQPLGTLSVL